jgi:hypothetical protein
VRKISSLTGPHQLPADCPVLHPQHDCFVVMPFGCKPLNAGSERTYDCDKVYRVLQKAVTLAGLKPVRADEHRGGVIHSAMFQALREARVVLADLSLENGNVYYEVGVRHALCPSGTVLVCRHGTKLPFDLTISRVVFYEFDGVSFDFEEAERLIGELHLALQAATQGGIDSPMHALGEGRKRTRQRGQRSG